MMNFLVLSSRETFASFFGHEVRRSCLFVPLVLAMLNSTNAQGLPGNGPANFSQPPYNSGAAPNPGLNGIPNNGPFSNGSGNNSQRNGLGNSGVVSSAPMIPSVGNDPGVVASEEQEAVQQSSAFAGLGNRWNSGGPLMYPLAACSLVVIALAVERLISLRRGRIIPRPFVRRFTECVQDGQLSHDEALEICDEFDCPVAEVFHAAVKRWGRPTVEVEQAVMDAGERIADGLRKYLRLFHAVSNVAPLLGLLGTVLGMIGAFDSLSAATSDAPPEMLATGISEALITTAAGLSVAIPAYLAYIFFSAKADKYLVEIDAICQQVVDSISAEGLQAGNSARTNTRRAKRAA